MNTHGLQPFDQLQADITMYVVPTKSITIKSESDAVIATDAGKDVKAWGKKVEDLRKAMVAPLNDQVKKINDYAKQIVLPLQEAEAHIKRQLVSWEFELNKKRREEQSRIEAEQRVRAEEARKKAQEDLKRAQSITNAKDAARAKAVAEAEALRTQNQIAADARKDEKALSEMKVSNTRKVWKFEVGDLYQVPREFLILDTTAVRKAITDGQTMIPGLKIWQETTVALRA